MKRLLLLIFGLTLTASTYAFQRVSPGLLSASAPAAGGGGCTAGTTIVDADAAVGGSAVVNVDQFTAATGGTFTGTNASDGELKWDNTEDWFESDSGSDGVHKYAWLSGTLASDIFTSTSVLNTTTGGTSTRTGVFWGKIRAATTLGWEGYRAYTGDGNAKFDRCASDGTCTNLLTVVQSNTSANRNMVTNRASGGVWYVSYNGVVLGTVTDTTYAVEAVGIYIRNLGRVKSITATCQ